MLADNGSAWFISGVPDERWDNDELHELGAVKGSDFEAVDVSAHIGLLQAGVENVLAIHGLNISTGSSDFLIDADPARPGLVVASGSAAMRVWHCCCCCC